MTEAQIKYMVSRFLAWKLPANFNPDGGVAFSPVGNPDTPHEYRNEPSGTNLLDAVQAEAMVRHMLEGMPSEFPWYTDTNGNLVINGDLVVHGSVVPGITGRKA